MTKFAVAYSSFLIGFMVMFMIIFSEQDAFNINFLGVFGKVIHLPKIRSQLIYFLKVLVMMTGEFEYVDLMYPETQNIMKQNDTWSKIKDANNEIDYNHFPGLSHLSVLGFIIFLRCTGMPANQPISEPECECPVPSFSYPPTTQKRSIVWAHM